MENNIYCPIIKGYIKDGTCYDIHMVAEGLAPERTVLDLIGVTKNYKELCMNCKSHKE